MAADCNCPECGDHLGKDTECDIVAWCGNGCGYFYNPRGEKIPDEYMDDEKREVLRNGRRRGW